MARSTDKMKKFALIGNNVSKSKSKLIHESLSPCRYDLLTLAEEDFDSKIDEILQEYDALNATIPYKQRIIEKLDYLAESVERTGSCNTVVKRGGKLYGYSTDGDGFMLSIADIIDVNGKNVLLLGAGGAALSVAYSLEKAGAKLSIYNRTRENAEKLVKKCNIIAKICDNQVCFQTKYDIIINTTSVGKEDDAMPIDISQMQSFGLAVDIIYRETAFLKAAKAHGATTLDGLGMLVYQAILAHEQFIGESLPRGSATNVFKILAK